MGYDKFGPEDRKVTVMGSRDDVSDVKASVGGKVDERVDVTDSKGKGIDPIVFAGLQNQRNRVRNLLNP